MNVPGKWRLLGGTSLLIASLVISGCNRARIPYNPDDYVEIDNPYIEGDPSENQKIWVPKSSLEKGIPRGGELAKKGYDAVVSRGNSSESPRTVAEKPDQVRHRLLLAFETGSTLDRQLADLLRNGFSIRTLGKPAPSVTASEEEKLNFVTAAGSPGGGGPVLLVGTPDGVTTGAAIKAELFDSRGPVLFRSITVKIPKPEQDEALDEAVQRALSGLAGAIRELLGRFPWYGRVITVSGDRVYLDSGAESGLKPGQRLVVYRGGEVVKQLGFAPGERITTITLTDYVGLDGSYAASADAARVKPGDFVELDRSTTQPQGGRND